MKTTEEPKQIKRKYSEPNKKTYILLPLFVALISLIGCATITSYFAGTVGGIYVSTDMYSADTANGDYTNNSYELNSALWPYTKGIKASNVEGHKVLFYSDLEDKGFYNELVPEEYRANSLEDAGFILVAVPGHDIFYQKYNVTGTSDSVNVYYGTGTLRLYSIKTGELLEKSSPVKGPTPPESFSCPVGVSTTWWDYPAPTAFKSTISSMCRKIASGRIKSSIPDEATIAAAIGTGVEPKEKKTNKEVQISGVWSAETHDMKYVYTFTNKGHCIRESYIDNVLNYISVDQYTFENSVLTIDETEVSFRVEGKTIIFDDMSDLTFRIIQGKAIEKSVVIGVWSGKTDMDDYQVAFASNGLFICQGSSNHMGNWELNKNTLEIDKNNYEFFTVNNVLYILDEWVFGTYSWIRLERVSTEGKDNTTFSNLTSQEWDYRARGGQSGHIYLFSPSYTYVDTPYNGTDLSTKRTGTYSFNNHVIDLSTGSRLSFVIVDNTPLGFDM